MRGTVTRPPRSRRLLGFTLICYWIALFVSTHVPLPESTFPGQSDKLAHFAAYALLAFLFGLWVSSLQRMRARNYVFVFALMAAYGIVDELLQTPVGRDTDRYDMLADCIGSIVGLVALFVTLQMCGRSRRPIR